MKQVNLSWLLACVFLVGCCTLECVGPVDRNIKPYLHYWVKNNMTEESRRADSWTCGAGNTIYGADHLAFSEEQANAEKKPDEKDDIAARLRLEKKWKDCMKSMGYRYTS